MRGAPIAGGMALALLLPASALAGGTALPVRGIRALSMGGAFVAGAEGGNALWSNPARMRESSALVELGAVWMDATYTAPSGATAENQAAPLPNPTAALVFEIVDGLSVGAGLFAPYSPQHRFDPEGPQRYALVSSHTTTLAHIALGISAELGPVEIGASVQNVMAHIRQRSVLSGYSGIFGAPTDPELDIVDELELRDDFTLTGSFGLTFTQGPVRIGAALQLPYTVSGDASFRVRLPSSVFFDAASVEGETVRFEVPFPFVARGGVSVQVSDAVRLEAAMTFENWSVQQELRIDPQGSLRLRGVPAVGDYELPPLVIDRRMRDTWSAHLGGEWGVTEGFDLRAGAFYETSAFPDATFSVAQLDGEKLGLALGGRAEIGDFGFEAAVAHVFQGTRDITDSELRQINPTNPEQAVVVGNGRYESGLWVGGLGVEWMY